MSESVAVVESSPARSEVMINPHEDIASGWSLIRLKYVATIYNGLDYKHVQAAQGYPVIGSGGRFAYANRYMYDGEAVLLGRKGTVDKPLYINGKFWAVDTMFYAVCSTAVHAKYIYYMATRIPFSFYSTSTALPSMTQSDLMNHAFPIPPKREQIAVAHFLDQKTSQIDEAVSAKEQQITLLKERKQILIQNAVTRGLNSNVPMRNSGVEWIGEIPAHWQLKRLKYVLDERNERSQTGEEPLLMVSQKHGLVVRSEYHEKAEVALSKIDNKIVHQNDLVFNKLKAHLGVFFKSSITFKGIVSPDYAVYTLKDFVEDAKFLEHLFRHPAYIGQFIVRATGIVEGLIRLYTTELFEMPIPIAPIEEQREILKFIETNSEKMDDACSLLEQQIARLKEYKVTLINSAVTGKIKVPGVVEPGDEVTKPDMQEAPAL